ncbi:MAG: sugar-binding transcriptional regulator [Dorea sp.]|jgi:deoxyribonucleoside regulator|nr:sugar-binding transcriptional regulator [Dorea sp.]
MDMKRRRMVLASKLYYKDNLTQQQIAQQLNVSRMKVSRLIQQAKDEGVVRITIDYSGTYPELEKELRDKYRLKDVVVIDTTVGVSAKEQVASAAAFYLENYVRKKSVVAVGWGTTMKMVPDYIHQMESQELTFSPIIGGQGQRELDMHATTIASNFAKKTGGRALSLIAPALVENGEEKQILMKNELLHSVVETTANAQYAIFSLGNPQVINSSISKSGYFIDEDLAQLEREDAVCDLVSTVFLNRNSRECCRSITDRCIGITGRQLKEIPNKICVVEGEEKKESVKAALDGGYIDILIVDQVIAEYLI